MSSNYGLGNLITMRVDISVNIYKENPSPTAIGNSIECSDLFNVWLWKSRLEKDIEWMIRETTKKIDLPSEKIKIPIWI